METLPNEIVWHIISYLKEKSLVCFSLTSRRNRFLVSNSKNNNGDIIITGRDFRIFLESNLNPRLFNLVLTGFKITDVYVSSLSSALGESSYSIFKLYKSS